MQFTKDVKRRMRSVKNTAQITKAMEVVSATKMRKAQEFALNARPYAAASLEMLENLLARTPVLPPLLRSRAIKNTILVVITSDKGLAGAFNANVLRKAEAWVSQQESLGASYALITVGKKAKEFFERRAKPIAHSFWGYGDFRQLGETLPVANLILDGFAEQKWDRVDAVYTNFRTTLIQETALRKMLPVSREGIREAVRGILPERGRYSQGDRESMIEYNYEYKFEPSPQEILEVLVPSLLRMRIHHIILESNASEHSSRMVAMKSASDNAGELVDALQLMFNKARQADITREIVEITAGREALREH